MPPNLTAFGKWADLQHACVFWEFELFVSLHFCEFWDFGRKIINLRVWSKKFLGRALRARKRRQRSGVDGS